MNGYDWPRLIDQVAKEIWICDKQTVSPFKGSIQKYKGMLKAKAAKGEGSAAKF